MTSFIQIIFFILFYNLVHSQENASRSKQIEKLEEANKDLLKKINEAIKDSLDSLKQANTSEAVEDGIKLMKELHKYVNNSNGGEMLLIEDQDINGEERSNVTGRRRGHDSRNNLQLTLEELQKLFKKEAPSIDKYKYKLSPTHVGEMEVKLNSWFQQKRLEAQRIKQYREQKKNNILTGAEEKCPRYGVGRKSVKRGGRRRKPNYPCCRKCCKNSYMGCL